MERSNKQNGFRSKGIYVPLAILLAVATVSCGGSDQPTPTSVPTVAASPTPTAVPPIQTPLPADTIRVDLNNVAFILKIADTNDERSKGLIGVASMPENEGMLFVFDVAAKGNFWMKDTLIPLDMIWLAQDGTVADIKADIPTELGKADADLTLIRPNAEGKYVIELNAGSAKRVGLTVGMKVRLPPL
ncbi:MAG: DUF192 domain-containing protein [Dehalococcoidia bacterium]|nr:DUF192 domain-containing protein [Dehalococcoidia bacterium]